MIRDLICLTIDTDPDGMTAQIMDRNSQSWRGLENIRFVVDELKSISLQTGSIPVTWFIRADAEIRHALGDTLALAEKFSTVWEEASRAGDAFGWHPHLYREIGNDKSAAWFGSPAEAAQELRSLWEIVRLIPLPLTAFRNGESWHNPVTFAEVEGMGFSWDSTAIPGRRGPSGHPMDWIGTPNHPYFPDIRDVRVPGDRRALLEIPLTSWLVKTIYDTTPRIRYVNPAIHEPLFLQAIAALKPSQENRIWTLVIHPDEAYAGSPSDLLYSRCPKTVRRNIETLVNTIQGWDHEFQFVSLPEAGCHWLEWLEAS